MPQVNSTPANAPNAATPPNPPHSSTAAAATSAAPQAGQRHGLKPLMEGISSPSSSAGQRSSTGAPAGAAPAAAMDGSVPPMSVMAPEKKPELGNI